MTVLLHIAWWSSYQNVKCSVDLPSIMREFLDVSQSTWSCNIARLVYKWCKEPNKIASFSI